MCKGLLPLPHTNPLAEPRITFFDNCTIRNVLQRNAYQKTKMLSRGDVRENCKMKTILFSPQYVNSSGAETRILHENEVNTLAADALAPCVARSSAAMLFNVHNRWVLIFHEEGVQPAVPSQCWAMIGNINIFCIFPKIHSAQQGLTHLTSPWTKWLPFRRWYFQVHFCEWKILYFDDNFTEVCSYESDWL